MVIEKHLHSSPQEDDNDDDDSKLSSPPKKRFACPKCGRLFSRQEHVDRHFASHSNATSFRCLKCGRAFGRRDALKRHQSVHQPRRVVLSPVPTSQTQQDDTSTDARRRAALSRTKRACLRCARAKLKCDGLEPCSRCRERDDGAAEACRYSTPSSSSSSSSLEPNLFALDQSSSSHDRYSPVHESSNPTWSGITRDNTDEEADHSMMDATTTTIHDNSIDWSAAADNDGGAASMSLDPALMGLGNNTTTPSNTNSTYFHDEQPQFSSRQAQDEEGKHPHHPHQHEEGEQQQQDIATTDGLIAEYSSVFDWISAGTGSSPYDGLPWSTWLDAANANNINTLPTPQQAATTPAVTTTTATTPHRVTFVGVSPPENHRNSLDVLSAAALRHTTGQAQSDASTEDTGATSPTTMEPVDVRQPSRRNSTSSQRWPNSWHPQEGAGVAPSNPTINLVENAGEEVDLLENTYQVDGFDDEARKRLLQMCSLTDMPPQELRRVHETLSSVTNATFNVMVQLFFEKFEDHAFVHRATFKTSQCNVLLLGAICSIGTMYSTLPKAHNLGSILVDLVHRAIMATTSKDNLHARSLSSIQALVLVCLYLARSSNRRHLEHAEACRSAVITMVRRCRLLDDVPPPPFSRQDPSHWHDWINWETGRRVGWAVFVADMALCTSWKLAPCFSLDELKAQLPGDEAAWDAPDADSWVQSCLLPHSSLTLSAYHDALQQDSIGGLIRDQATVFQASIVAYSLSLMSMSLTAMQESCLAKQALPLCAHFRDRLRMAVNDAGTGNSPSSSTFEFVTRFTLLRMAVNFHDLQAMGSRRGREEAARARDRVRDHFDMHPEVAREVAVDAGRILYLFKTGGVVATCDVNAFYYAAVSLLAFSMHWQAHCVLSPTQTQEQRIVRLDSRELVRPTDRARLVLAGVGELHDKSAPAKIVQSTARFLFSIAANAPSHHAAQTLASVLSSIST